MCIRDRSDADLRLFISSDDAPLVGVESLEKTGDIYVESKCDVFPSGAEISVSAVTGEGLENLVAQIVQVLSINDGVSAVFARGRQIDCLRIAFDQLEASIATDEAELRAEHLRGGVEAMNHLFGDIKTEEVLGKIFSQFCIGK